MEVKKKRGSNYTPAEKDILLKLIRKYHNIIESKETNAHMIFKKRRAWDSVCEQYNTVAVSGIRTWQQLRHLYENMKQRSKKNLAKNNKELQRTGVGAYKNILIEQEGPMLPKVELQVTPLDPYDVEAVYFHDQHASTDVKPDINCMVGCDKPSPSTSNYDGPVKNQNEEIDVKQEYFRKKLRNAKLENKYLINKHKMEVNKYKLEMEILKLRLRKLKSSSRK